jgi:RNA polymerase sigma-70 factor, ECF subfamily
MAIYDAASFLLQSRWPSPPLRSVSERTTRSDRLPESQRSRFLSASPIWGCTGSREHVTAPLSDTELIARVVVADDARAFEQLVLRHQGVVRGFLCHLTSEADDVAQETFLRAYRRLANFRGDSKFSTWLIAIAYNELRQLHRRHAQQHKVVSALKLEARDGDSVVPVEVHDLPKILAWLPEEERVAMVLSYAHGCSHSEIALVTGLPIGTVKSKLNRAKARILEHLNGEVKEHG